MKIDLLKIIPGNVRIQLGEVTQNKLLDEAMKISGKQKNLAKMLNLSRLSVYYLLSKSSRPTLETLKKLMEITKMEIDNQELSLSMEASNRQIKVKRYIEIDEEFMWFLGFWEGDNSDNTNNLGVGNTDINISRRAFNFLKSFIGENEISVRFEFSPQIKITEEVVNDMAKKIGIKKCRSITAINKKGRNKTFIELKIYSTPLKKTFLKIRELLRNKLVKMPENLKIMFLQGFFDADGSINIKKQIATYWQKGNQKGYENLKLVKNLLNSLKIKSSKIKIQNKKRDIIRLDVLKGQKGKNISLFIKIGSTSIEKSEKMKIVNLLLLRH